MSYSHYLTDEAVYKELNIKTQRVISLKTTSHRFSMEIIKKLTTQLNSKRKKYVFPE